MSLTLEVNFHVNYFKIVTLLSSHGHPTTPCSNPTIPINVLNYNFPFAAGEWERVERYVQYYFLAVLNNEKLCVFASVACELKTSDRDGEFLWSKIVKGVFMLG